MYDIKRLEDEKESISESYSTVALLNEILSDLYNRCSKAENLQGNEFSNEAMDFVMEYGQHSKQLATLINMVERKLNKSKNSLETLLNNEI